MSSSQKTIAGLCIVKAVCLCAALLMSLPCVAADADARAFTKAMKSVDNQLDDVADAQQRSAAAFARMQRDFEDIAKAAAVRAPTGVQPDAKALQQRLDALQKSLRELRAGVERLYAGSTAAGQAARRLKAAVLEAEKLAEEKRKEERRKARARAHRETSSPAPPRAKSGFDHKLARELRKLTELKAERDAFAAQAAAAREKTQRHLAAAKKRQAVDRAEVEGKRRAAVAAETDRRVRAGKKLNKDRADIEAKTEGDLKALVARFEREKAALSREKQKRLDLTAGKYADALAAAEKERQRQEKLCAAEERTIDSRFKREEAAVNDQLTAVQEKEREHAEAVAKQEARIRDLKRSRARYAIQDVVVTGDQDAVYKLPAWRRLREDAAAAQLSDNDIQHLCDRLLGDLRKAGYRNASVEVNTPSLALGFLKFRVHARP